MPVSLAAGRAIASEPAADLNSHVSGWQGLSVQRLPIVLAGTALAIAAAVFMLWPHGEAPPANQALAPKEAQPRRDAPPAVQQAGAPTAAAPQAAATPRAVPSPVAPPPVPVPPSFDIVKVDPNGSAVIAGRAAPGAKVEVLDGDRKLGEETANVRGEWVLTPTQPLPAGEHQLSLQASDPKTRTKTGSNDTVALAVAPPSSAGGGSAPNAVAVLLPGDTNQPAQALQTPNPSESGLSLDTAGYNAKGQLMLSGHAAPGASLRLYADNQSIGSATADAAGRWSALTSPRAGAGKVELRVDQLASDGSVARRVAEPFEPPAAPAAAAPASAATARMRHYTVRQGNSLWVIARQAYGEGTQYTVIFSANRGNIRDPNLIYPGQVITLPKS